MKTEPIIVRLHGPLADRYGHEHRFVANSPREAVAALSANHDGFRNDFIRTGRWAVYADGDWREGEDAPILPVSRSIDLVPVVDGRAFIGAALIGALIPSIAGTAAATFFGGLLVTGLLLGVSMLLTPKVPKNTGKDTKKNDSYSFSGPENITGQGGPVPLLYGRAWAGSQVISTGIETEDFVGTADGDGTWGSSGSGNGALRSRQILRTLDLISEGPIRGIRTTPNLHYNLAYDGTRLRNADGSWNVDAATITERLGTADQSIINGFASQQAETAVSLQLKTTADLTRTITNSDVDRVRITVSTPNLSNTALKSGKVNGNKAEIEVLLSANGGAYNRVGIITLNGKAQSRYQRAVVFKLTGSAPWNVRLHRITADSTTTDNQNDTYWDSYTEIIDDRVRYRYSAVTGHTISAEQYSSPPRRAQFTDGRLIQVPVNYNPETRTYSGPWDGTFKTAWSNNPAWVFYDLVLHNRYGLGNYIESAEVDRYALYSIGQWCDQNVSTGSGGVEPRFTCNAWITERLEAYQMLAGLASVFRGFTYWADGQMVAVADRPVDPVLQYSNADVIDGLFTYSGSDIKAQHTAAMVKWNDPARFGEERTTMVEASEVSDSDLVAERGLIPTDVRAIGCTSESMARRAGKWTLFTELYESETVTFRVGIEGQFAMPGDVIRIADKTRAGIRRGGRIISASTTQVTVDKPVDLVAGEDALLSVYVSDGTLQLRDVTAVATNVLSVSPAFSAAPAPGTSWVLTSGDLEATTWRVLQVTEHESDRQFEIMAMQHRPDKWAVVEANAILDEPVTTILPASNRVTNLQAKDYLVPTTSISLSVEMLVSWTGRAPSYIVEWRPVNGNWRKTEVFDTSFTTAVDVGDYEIRVTPQPNAIGLQGVPQTLIYTVTGSDARPANVTNFKIQVVNGVALLTWDPSPDLDVVIGGSFELRWSPIQNTVNWTSATTVIPSIPGTATTVETAFRPGTYLLVARDAGGLISAAPARASAQVIKDAYTPFFTITESPTFPGTKTNVTVKTPENWLILSTGQTSGTYLFNSRFNFGMKLTTRLTLNMFASPYSPTATLIDARPLIDTWSDFDDVGADLTGTVRIECRTTDTDPDVGTPTWSPWTLLQVTDIVAWGVELRAILTAPTGQNVLIETLEVTADLSAKVDRGSISWPGSGTVAVTFDVDFYQQPSLTALIQNEANGDRVVILSKDANGFTMEVRNGASLAGAKTVDWIAAGY